MFVTLNLFPQTTKHKPKSKKTINVKSSEDQGGPAGDIVIAIKDKVYFYNDSKIKTNFYFLKGQQAEYYEISDDDPDDDFLYVNFELKGKVKTGYILKSDVKFKNK
jgi:hypothetical protein